MGREELKEYKETLKLTQQQRNIVVGTLLGDSSLLLPKKSVGKNTCYLKFEQSIKKELYIKHLYGIFEDWCGTGPKIRNIKGGGAKDRMSIGFRTYGHKSLLFYNNQFYKVEGSKRIKVVPKLLYKWMNEEVLAYWFMDDGSKERSGYILNTQGFSYTENKVLAKVLGKKFCLSVSIQKDKTYFRLAINAESKEKFTFLIKSYVLPIFKYKLHTIS